MLHRSPRFLLLTALLAACGGQAPIRIGLAGPFDQARGVSMRLAAELAVREINGSGGVRGRQLELVELDDSAQAERAVAIARQLTADRSVVAVVGHLTSGATLAGAPIYGGARPVVLISPSASSPLLSEAGPWIFRVCPTDQLHGARLSEWALTRLHASRAAVIYLNDDYGRGVRDVFETAFANGGGTVVTDDPYLDDLPSFRPYLERLQRRGADVLLIAGTRAGAERILATRDSLGMRLPVVAGDGVAGIESAGPAADGMLISTAYLPDQLSQGNAAFVQAYRRMASGRPPDHRGAGAYDAIRLLAHAIDAVGPDRLKIRDYLAGVGTTRPAFEGVTGRIAFDEHGDVPGKAITVGVVHNGALHAADGT